MKTEVLVKLLSDNAKMPKAMRPGDGAFDLYSTETIAIYPGKSVLIGTGIAVEIPSHTCGQIWPRSGLSVSHSIETGAGFIDSNYRGEIKVKLYNFGDEAYTVNTGDRIAQIGIIHKASVDFINVGDGNLSTSERLDKGFGSSGV